MIYWGFQANSTQAAADWIVRNYLSNDTYRSYHRGRETIIYFDGWEGLGASAVLAAIAESTRSAGSKFDYVIHVDCSVWESRREMQRRIAEELKIDARAVFDKHDEDDDFMGIDKGSRSEIADVAELIFQTVKDRTCLMILYNGNDEEVDFAESGVPVFDWRCKVLWTFRGKFRLDPIIRDRVKSAHVFLYAHSASYGYSWYGRELVDLVRQEAAQVIHDVDPIAITDCWFYLSLLHSEHDNSIDYDRDSHASNYWVCDGIISGDSAWEIGGQLQEAMRLKYHPADQDHDRWFDQFSRKQHKKSRWISTTSKSAEIQNIKSIPKKTTSYFLTEESEHPAILPNHLFEQSSKLRVLRLSWCCFCFASPPFICCTNLRFISIDSCSDEDVELIGKRDDKQDTEWAFLQRLWVLDIRRTRWDWILSPSKMVLMIELRELNMVDAGASWSDWGMANLEMTWLCDLQRLRVISSSTFLRALPFMDMKKLELLDLSGNIAMKDLPNLSVASRLKVLILDGCDGLQHVEPDAISTSLESFSFDGFGRASRWKSSLHIPEKGVRPSSRDSYELPKVSKISLEGCAQLQSVFLRGLPNLEELNLSKTAIQALDLDAMQVKKLERLFLIGCPNLRRVQWERRKPPLKLLCVDTREKYGRSMDGDYQRSHSHCQLQDFAQVVATDARFLGGLLDAFSSNFHLRLSSTVSTRQVAGTKETKHSGCSDVLDLVPVVGSSCPYLDVLDKVAQKDNDEDRGNQACTQLLPSERHIEFAKGDCNWELKGGHGKTMVSLMNYAQSLHVHDNFNITAANLELEEGTQFKNLRWCRIERCPKLHRAFFVDSNYMSRSSFQSLETFWASHLLGVRSIWSRELSFWTMGTETTPAAFSQLRLIHLHSCPRLFFVLPWSFPTLASLETIHITDCGELRQIFPKGKTYRQELATNIEFPNLRNIHLQGLPMLQHICETNMTAPMLETIKLIGCRSLRRLPAIHVGRQQDKPLAVVNCEKDWWDKLQWDGLEASRRLFSPRHSRYYKKNIPRGSLLR